MVIGSSSPAQEGLGGLGEPEDSLRQGVPSYKSTPALGEGMLHGVSPSMLRS